MSIEEVNFYPVQEVIYEGYEEKKAVEEVKTPQTKSLSRERLLYDAFNSEGSPPSSEEIDFFLRLGADPNYYNQDNGESVIFRANESCASDESIGTLLGAGAKVESNYFRQILGKRDPHILVEVAEAKGVNLLEDLLSEDPVDNYVALTLINAGADLDFEIKGQSPLEVAKAHGASDRVVSAMIAHGAVVPIEEATSLEELFTEDQLDSKAAIALIKNGMSPDFTVDGNSPLAIAIEKGASPELIRAMIHAGVDLDNKNGTLDAPVFLAARKFDIDTLDLLAEAGADFNARTKEFNMNLLTDSIDRTNNKDIDKWKVLASKLVNEYPMDPNTNWGGMGDPMMRSLARANSNIAENSNWAFFDHLRNLGFNPNDPIDEGNIRNLLSWAIASGIETPTIKTLVNEKGFYVNSHHQGWDPIGTAMYWGNGRPDVTEFLNSKRH